jgi:hypothetical protein
MIPKKKKKNPSRRIIVIDGINSMHKAVVVMLVAKAI